MADNYRGNSRGYSGGNQYRSQSPYGRSGSSNSGGDIYSNGAPTYRPAQNGYSEGRRAQGDPSLEAKRRAAAKRRALAKKKAEQKRRRRKVATIVFIFAAVLFALGFISGGLFLSSPLEKSITVEAGSKAPAAEAFVKEKKREKTQAAFETDMSKISLKHVGEHEILLTVKGKQKKSKLVVVDTVAPKAKFSTEVSLPLGIKLSEAELAKSFVKSVQDKTDVVYSVKSMPSLNKEGQQSLTVLVTDEGKNQASKEVTLVLVRDTEPPVISGVAPISVFVGDTISYKSGITVKDDLDPTVELKVDNSSVNADAPGKYNVTYTATDKAGNKSTASTFVKVDPKPANFVSLDTVNQLADEILQRITTEGMTKREKAKAIYNWCRGNIGYTGSSEKESWTNGAYQGFTRRSGDCYTYFSAAKVLLTRVGIPNIDVVKSDTSHSSHYWSLVDVGDGWYHFDATPRIGGGNFFLLTDARLEAYSVSHKNSHIFDRTLYPATPKTESTVK